MLCCSSSVTATNLPRVLTGRQCALLLPVSPSALMARVLAFCTNRASVPSRFISSLANSLEQAAARASRASPARSPRRSRLRSLTPQSSCWTCQFKVMPPFCCSAAPVNPIRTRRQVRAALDFKFRMLLSSLRRPHSRRRAPIGPARRAHRGRARSRPARGGGGCGCALARSAVQHLLERFQASASASRCRRDRLARARGSSGASSLHAGRG